MDALTAELDHIKPDVLIIDPLINVMGGANANDNATAALLMGELAGLAATRRMAIALAHHTSKGREVTSAESAMGAASFINLARIALAIEPLDEKNAGHHRVAIVGGMVGLPRSWNKAELQPAEPEGQMVSAPQRRNAKCGATDLHEW